MKYAIRVWAEQTLFACCDYWVEADTPEQAAILARDLTDEASNSNGGWAADARVTSFGPGHYDVVGELDPEEIVDSFQGVTLLDDDGNRVRDMIGVPTGCAQLGEPIKESAL